MFMALSILFLGLIVALIIGLIRPFRFWPMSKTKPTRKTLGMTFGGLLLVCFILMGITAPTTKVADTSMHTSLTPTPIPTKIVALTSSPTSTPKKIVPTSTPTPTPKPVVKTPPTQLKTPEQILQGVLDKYGKNDNDVLQQQSGQWYLVKFVDPTDSQQRAKSLSRNFIFDTFATKLPIREVVINVGSFSDRNNFQEALCGDVANKQPQSTWTQNRDNDPFGEQWYTFLTNNANGNAGDDCYTGVVNNIQ